MKHSSNANDDLRFVELLGKWQSGAFTREDERELESLAARDPFRREALEGYLEHPEMDHGVVLERLRLQLRARGRRRVAFPQILAVAAALTLILGAVWFFNNNPAQEAIQPVAQELPTRTEPESAMESPVASAPGREAAPAASARDYNTDRLPPEVEKKKDATKALGAGSSSDVSANTETAKAEDLAAVNEKESESSYDKPGAPAVQSTNIGPAREQAEEKAKRAKTSAAGKAKSTTPTQPDSINTPLQPEMGWEQFRLYLNANARLTQEALAHNVTGIVRVQFALDTDRKPNDFRVLRSLGYGCDEQAERLIKNVRWEGAPGATIAVDVSFVR